MDIDVRARHMTLSKARRHEYSQRVETALDRFETKLRRVLVVLEDVNGTRGGADKRCRIRATGERGFAVQSQATEVTATAAVDRAADGIGRNVAKAVGRRRDFAGRNRTSMAGEGRSRR